MHKVKRGQMLESMTDLLTVWKNESYFFRDNANDFSQHKPTQFYIPLLRTNAVNNFVTSY